MEMMFESVVKKEETTLDCTAGSNFHVETEYPKNAKWKKLNEKIMLLEIENDVLKQKKRDHMKLENEFFAIMEENQKLREELNMCHKLKEEKHELNNEVVRLTKVVQEMEVRSQYHIDELNKCKRNYSIANQKFLELKVQMLQISVTEEPKENMKLTCSICLRVFQRPCGLARHAITHNKRKRKIVQQKQEQNKNKKNGAGGRKNSHRKRVFVSCDECGRNFTNKKNLQDHQQVHRLSSFKIVKKEGKLFACKYCDQIFPYPCFLREHENKHTGAKPYTCDVCSKSFAYRASAYTHTRTHNKSKEFACSNCKYSCTQRAHLWRHMQVHHRNKSYKCKFCNASYKAVGYLKQHIKKIHS